MLVFYVGKKKSFYLRIWIRNLKQFVFSVTPGNKIKSEVKEENNL